MSKKTLLVPAIVIIAGACLFIVSSANAWDYALSLVGGKVGYQTSGSKSELLYIVNIGLKAFLSLLAIIFFAVMMYAGLRWMTARGNEEYSQKAKNALTAGSIGFIIVVSSYAISTFVFNRMLLSSSAVNSTSGACTQVGTKSPSNAECMKIKTSSACKKANCTWSPANTSP